jgi:hypothetical protein
MVLIGSEPPRSAPRRTGRAYGQARRRRQGSSALIEFDDAIVSAVDHSNVLVWRDQQTVGVTDAGPLLDEVAVGVEDQDPLIFAVADLYAALIVDGDGVRQIEFADASAEFSPSLAVITLAIKLHFTKVAIAIGDVNVAAPGKGYIGGLVKPPVCFRASIDSAEDEPNVAGGVELED